MNTQDKAVERARKYVYEQLADLPDDLKSQIDERDTDQSVKLLSDFAAQETARLQLALDVATQCFTELQAECDELRKADGWREIAVDGLPEATGIGDEPLWSDRLLVVVKNSGIGFGRCSRFPDGHWTWRVEGHHGEWEVIAWMPIPPFTATKETK
jgi:hypothetical protein